MRCSSFAACWRTAGGAYFSSAGEGGGDTIAASGASATALPLGQNYTVASRNPLVQYRFRVRALNTQSPPQESAWSEYLLVESVSSRYPSTPIELAATSVQPMPPHGSAPTLDCGLSSSRPHAYVR